MQGGEHGLINYIDTEAKCRHLKKLKKLTCKGTLRQVFIRVYRLEIKSVMWVFSTQLCELSPYLKRRPGIDSEDSIPRACVAWRAGTTNRVVVPAHQAGNRFLGS